MSSNFYSVGLNHVGAYQVSGTPFLTSSVPPSALNDSLRIQFPSVTKKLTIRSHHDEPLRIHFAPWDAADPHGYSHFAGTEDNYVGILEEETVDIAVKCKEVFISVVNTGGSGNIEVFAELTNIPAERMFSLDGVEGVSS